MRPLVLCKAHTIAQRRRSPNVLVWSVKAREEWFKTLQRGAQESCDRRGAKQEQSDYLDSDNKPYDRTKHRARHHLGSIEPRSRRKRSYWLPKDTIRSPNLKEILKCSCEVLKAMEWVKISHTVAGSEVCSCMVEKKWSQAHASRHTRPRWGSLIQIQILSQKGKKTWGFDPKDGIFRV